MIIRAGYRPKGFSFLPVFTTIGLKLVALSFRFVVCNRNQNKIHQNTTTSNRRGWKRLIIKTVCICKMFRAFDHTFLKPT